MLETPTLLGCSVGSTRHGSVRNSYWATCSRFSTSTAFESLSPFMRTTLAGPFIPAEW